MQYQPSPNSGRDLIDPEDIVARTPLPRPVKDPSRPRTDGFLQRRLHLLDPRMNRYGGIILTLALMALGFYLLASAYLAIVGTPQILPMGVILVGCFGASTGGMLLWLARINDNHDIYARTHSFLFVGLGLALFDIIPQSLALGFMGPLLVGFGAGSILAAFIPLSRR